MKTVYKFSMTMSGGIKNSVCIFGDNKKSPTREQMVNFAHRQIKKCDNDHEQQYWRLVESMFEHSAGFPTLNENEDYTTYYSLSVERIRVFDLK